MCPAGLMRRLNNITILHRRNVIARFQGCTQAFKQIDGKLNTRTCPKLVRIVPRMRAAKRQRLLRYVHMFISNVLEGSCYHFQSRQKYRLTKKAKLLLYRTG